MRFKLLPLYLIAVFVLFGIFLIQKSEAVSTGVLIEMTPSSPAPGENTTITLKSYVDNLDSVMISWSVNGKKSSSGIGQKTFSVNAPEAGTETVVSAILALSSGTVEEKVSIKPAVMVMLWQATDSYVPPFYRGKALPSPDSEVKVVAMPEIKSGSSNISPSSMVYSWARDYNNYTEGSGYGKNYFSYINDYLDNSNYVAVKAATIDQKYSLNGSLNIGMTEPKIVFYKNDPKIGTAWQHAIGDTYTLEEPETVEAVPYFISPKQLINPVLTWDWSINDRQVQTEKFKENLMPLQAPEGTHGSSKLRLEIANTEKLFQRTSKEINVQF